MTTMLYIEESKVERTRLNQKLMARCYNVLNAFTAEEAEELLTRKRVDYVLIGNWGSERVSSALAEYLALLPADAPGLVLPPLLSLLRGILAD